MRLWRFALIEAYAVVYMASLTGGTASLSLSLWWLLQSAQRKALDIINLLGLSNSIMRVAERRDSVSYVVLEHGM
jgi:hypothetical protein